MTRIAFLPGDGVGPQVLAAGRRVLQAAGFEAEWVDLPVGWSQWCQHGAAISNETLQAMRATDAAFFGAITSKPTMEAEAELAPGLRRQGLRYQSPILRIRQEFSLGVNLRPVASIPGNTHALHPDVDLVIVRENTEGLYAGLEAHPVPQELADAVAATMGGRRLDAGEETAVALRVVTRTATRRLMDAAFEHAAASGRRKVTLVEKANVLRATGGLVRRVFAETAADHPEIQTEEVHVDAACARLVTDPSHFDVIVATNLFGDILSDVAAAAAGGLPLAASANIGSDYALFEPVHGSAPDIEETGQANPIGAVLAGAMMARHLGQGPAAERLERAVRVVVGQGRVLPADLGGTATTDEVTQAIIEAAADASRSSVDPSPA